ncbi:bifunctional adenosylcobinamide kinase/adenosylcobinamide-phosphate guanylyltransferase [candidate division KSB1 bacterium]|nr:bifunctional adenosylcobinamide kinase/adenosylcobinamide-phosphate guanylyltransferase [candidate division KSB1 bacterium]
MAALKNKLIFIIGGARSGKSRHALQLSQAFQKKAFVATAVVTDEEMRARIQKHQTQRGPEWRTFEEPYEIASLIRKEAANFDLMLLDCLTFWISNLLLKYEDGSSVMNQITRLKDHLKQRTCSFIIVTNEVGSGIVPESPLARRFRDLAGTANQEIAVIADQVFLTVAGIPLEIK